MSIASRLKQARDPQAMAEEIEPLALALARLSDELSEQIAAAKTTTESSATAAEKVIAEAQRNATSAATMAAKQMKSTVAELSTTLATLTVATSKAQRRPWALHHLLVLLLSVATATAATSGFWLWRGSPTLDAGAVARLMTKELACLAPTRR